MDAALVVSIAAAAVAAVTAVISYVAIRQSRAANELARQANAQADRFFSESGARVRVDLAPDQANGGAGVAVRSIGRLPAVIHGFSIECVPTGASFSAADLEIDDLPWTLAPTELRELWISAHRLAAASGLYGGEFEWRASAMLGDGEISSSPVTRVSHPDEATLYEQLAAFNQVTTGMIRKLNLTPRLSLDELDEMAAQRAEAVSELARISARFEQDRAKGFVAGDVTVMLVNGERSHRELNDMIALRRRTASRSRA